MMDLDKLEARLKKRIVGIGATYRTTALLQALKVQKMCNIIDFNNVLLFRNIMNNNSAARIFNMNLLSNKIKCKGTLFDRVQKICLARNIDINNMIFDDQYFKHIKCNMFEFVKEKNETIDTLRTLFKKGQNRDNIKYLKLLLRAF